MITTDNHNQPTEIQYKNNKCSYCQEKVAMFGPRKTYITKCARVYHESCLKMELSKDNKYCFECRNQFHWHILTNSKDFLSMRLKPIDQLLVQVDLASFDLVAGQILRMEELTPDFCITYCDRIFSPLLIAANIQDSEAVQLILKRGAKLNAESMSQALMRFSSESDYKEVAKILLEASPGINSADMEGNYLLFAAINNCQVEIVQLFLEYGANPNRPDSDGYTPLLIAAKTAKHWTANKADPCFNEYYNFIIQIVGLLLEKGANPNAALPDGTTPLHIAAQSGCSQIVERLLKYHANPQAIQAPLRFMKWRVFSLMIDQTPLHFARRYGHKEVATQIQDAIERYRQPLESRV